MEPIKDGSLLPPAPFNLFATNDDGIDSYAILGDGNNVLTNIEVTIIPAPEPSSVAVIASMLVPVGAIFYQRRMVRRSEAVVLLLKRLKQEKSVYTFDTNYLHTKRTETSAPVSVVSGGERLLSRILLSVFG